MGYYINPPDKSKEEFLVEHGTPVTPEILRNHDYKNSLPVVLVDNGPFTAAAIGYDKNETEYFLDTKEDRRRKMFFLVPKAVLVPYVPPKYLWS